MKHLLCVLFLFLLFKQSIAQIDLQCNGRDQHAIYLLDYTGVIYRVDSVDSNPSDAKTVTTSVPPNSIGLSINNNLDSAANQTVVYIADINGYFFYYNGNHWVTTNHSAGGGVNIGGSSQYIFDLNESSDDIYRYDGTANPTLILSNIPLSTGAVYDVAIDNLGNFYLFFTTNHYVLAYDPNGVKIDSFTTSGNNIGTQPGFAILGDKMYEMDNDRNLYQGVRSGKNINFTAIKSLPNVTSGDIASCPNAGNILNIFNEPNTPRFTIFPNPASSEAVIKFDNTTLIKIFDLVGREKLSVSTVGETSYNFSVDDWTPGVYLVEVRSAEGITAFSKLIVK